MNRFWMLDVKANVLFRATEADRYYNERGKDCLVVVDTKTDKRITLIMDTNGEISDEHMYWFTYLKDISDFINTQVDTDTRKRIHKLLKEYEATNPEYFV